MVNSSVKIHLVFFPLGLIPGCRHWREEGADPLIYINHPCFLAAPLWRHMNFSFPSNLQTSFTSPSVSFSGDDLLPPLFSSDLPLSHPGDKLARAYRFMRYSSQASTCRLWAPRCSFRHPEIIDKWRLSSVTPIYSHSGVTAVKQEQIYSLVTNLEHFLDVFCPYVSWKLNVASVWYLILM